MNFDNSICRAAHRSGASFGGRSDASSAGQSGASSAGQHGASPAGRHGVGSAFEVTCNSHRLGSAFEMTRNSRVSALQRQIWQLQLKYGRKFDLPEDLFACTSGDGETDPENIE